MREDYIDILQLPGELFIRALKLLAFPLVAVSMVVSPAALGGDLKKAKKIAKRMLIFYAVNTILAVILGVAMVLDSVCFVPFFFVARRVPFCFIFGLHADFGD